MRDVKLQIAKMRNATREAKLQVLRDAIQAKFSSLDSGQRRRQPDAERALFGIAAELRDVRSMNYHKPDKASRERELLQRESAIAARFGVSA